MTINFSTINANDLILASLFTNVALRDILQVLGNPSLTTDPSGIVFLESITSAGGLSFGEKFLGQLVINQPSIPEDGVVTLNEVLIGEPVSPLTLLPGMPGNNTAISLSPLPVLAPMGNVSLYGKGVGEGALSIQIASPATDFAIQTIGWDMPGTSVHLQAWGNDGSLIGESTVQNDVPNNGPDWLRGFDDTTFLIHSDIPFSGISITSNDVGGIGFTNFWYREGIIEPPNQAPVAVNETFTTLEDQSLIISQADVLNNFSDPNGDLISIASFSQPEHGSLTFDSAQNAYIFTPESNFNGQTSFQVIGLDPNGLSATSNITISIAPANDAPTALDDAFSTTATSPLEIKFSDLLSNDSDVDGDSISFHDFNSAGHGSVVLNSAHDGLLYTPSSAFVGTDSFSYSITDPSGEVSSANVSINVSEPPIASGHNFVFMLEDLINGGDKDYNDVIFSLEGLNASTNQGLFTVGSEGKISSEFLFDGGRYKGEVGIFFTSGMESLSAHDYLTEAIHRVASNTNGFEVLSDITQDAKFGNIKLGADAGWKLNGSNYEGSHDFSAEAGKEFGIIFVANGSFENAISGHNQGVFLSNTSMQTVDQLDHFASINDLGEHHLPAEASNVAWIQSSAFDSVLDYALF